MTAAELTEKLEARARRLEEVWGSTPEDAILCRQAAARLRSMEEALKKIADRPTAVGVNPQGLVDFARAALSGEKP